MARRARRVRAAGGVARARARLPRRARARRAAASAGALRPPPGTHPYPTTHPRTASTSAEAYHLADRFLFERFNLFQLILWNPLADEDNEDYEKMDWYK